MGQGASTGGGSIESRRGDTGKVPVIYSPNYNIGFWGLENLHPFDSAKYMKVYNYLIAKKVLSAAQVYDPPPATDEQLAMVHTSDYLKSLESSNTVAGITEVAPVALLPSSLARSQVLVPMLFGTGGTILGAVLAAEGPSYRLTPDARAHALAEAAAVAAAAGRAQTQAQAAAADAKAPAAAVPKAAAASAAAADAKHAAALAAARSATADGYQWAINLSGGYHHACGTAGGGFCVYADISLAILTVAKRTPAVRRFMIVDLDAHQGNGHENDKNAGVFERAGVEVFILDVYNRQVYPRDSRAKRAIDCRVELLSATEDKQYLQLVEENLVRSLDSFRPHFVVYNAGTDILDGDPLGQLRISPAGVAARDELVFRHAFARGVPLLMLLSGGYQKNNAQVIADSIENLNAKFGLIQRALQRSAADVKANSPASNAAAASAAAGAAAAPAVPAAPAGATAIVLNAPAPAAAANAGGAAAAGVAAAGAGRAAL